MKYLREGRKRVSCLDYMMLLRTEGGSHVIDFVPEIVDEQSRQQVKRTARRNARMKVNVEGDEGQD